MPEGPPQSNRTPTIAERAIFRILKSCRNRGSLFLQSTGLWLNCGKSTTLLQFRPIGFDCVEIAPTCDSARPSDKTANPTYPIGTDCKPRSHRSRYDCMRVSIQAQFCHDPGPRPHKVACRSATPSDIRSQHRSDRSQLFPPLDKIHNNPYAIHPISPQ